ncbi:lysoplasmalogenase [Algoriphagus machipongonensis]|uniref:Membrane protein n=1 Tax=Algoriphagus machipongonensis TaxID=388413 RepID=A3HY89_9BACT|nr:lysoplasmalogenase family protein [Algoriphagus machipongonensis]EAZ81562.1 membrane protein [Algoriphagus machipongonensis]
MKDKSIVWLYLFLFATLVDIAFLLEYKSHLRFFSKPLILLGLIIYFFKITKPIASTLLTKAILGALIFSWIGDILLLWPQLFAYGLGAFLLAHVCYIIGFKVAQKNPGQIKNVNFIKIFFLNLPFYILAAFVYYLTQPNLGILKIPVIIYIIAIVSMVTTARERFGKCNIASFWQVMIGASLFFISDGLLALNRFYLEFPESGILVMGTYAVAQLLIVMGIRSHLIQPQ